MDDIVTKIIELALGQGLWAALYIYLFFRMLNENKIREERVLVENKTREERVIAENRAREERILAENKAREDRYQATIDRLSNSIETKVAHIQETLDDMVSRETKI